jgi:hypothetical protein
MRYVLIVAALALAGCSTTEVMETGPGRYRVTSDNTMSAASAEAGAIGRAQEHCRRRGLMADTRIADAETRPYGLQSWGGASVDFTCVPRPIQ